MNDRTKISWAFEPFLSASGPNDKRDAIVIYRSPKVERPAPRGRLRALKRRLDYVKARAAVQQPVEAALFSSYQKAGAARLSRKQDLGVSSIGSSALPVANVEVTRKTLPALAEQDNVVAILPNQKIHPIKPAKVDYDNLARGEINDGITWGLKQLGIPKLWETTKGANVNVAVLDTGVYAEHPALAGRVQEFVVVDPIGRRITAQPSFDAAQHGTHVCGTIAGGKTFDGVSIGVAPEANLLAAGVLVGDATLRTLFEGISWAVENGADIINMSLGFTYYEPLFAEFLDILLSDFGVMPVVAIGNENHGNTSSPGNARSAFSVGAVEKVKGGKLDIAFFSGGASLQFPGQGDGALVTKPDVAAPGVQVYSSIPPEKTPQGTREYTYMDGTSMATPHVAGVAALLMAAKPQASVSDIMSVLKDTAKHPDGEDFRPDNRWGHGMIRPEEALQAL